MRHVKPQCLFAVILALGLSTFGLAQERLPDSAKIEAFATELINATTPAARSRMLAENKPLVTVRLRVILVARGNTFFAQGSYPQALDLFRLAQSVAEQTDDRAGIAATLLNIGSINYLQGNYAPALELYQSALAQFEQLHSTFEIANALLGIGMVYKEQGRHAQALEFLQRALRQYESIDNQESVAIALDNIGSIQYEQGEYAAAAKSLQQSLALREGLPDAESSVSTFVLIGNALYSQGNYTGALKYYRKSLALFEETGDRGSAGSALANIGNVYYAQGNYGLALEYYHRGLEADEAQKNRAMIANSRLGIGNAYRLQGNYALALENYSQSLALNEELGNKADAASVLGSIGIVYAAQGQPGRAIEYYQKSLAQHEALGDKSGMARTLSNTGNAHFVSGNRVAALESFERSRMLYEETGDRAGVARSTLGAGIVLAAQGEHVAALTNFQKSRQQFEALGNMNEAATAMLRIASVHMTTGDYAAALDFAEQATLKATATNNLESLWQARLAAGKAQYFLNRSTEARQALTEAISTIEILQAQPAVGEQGSHSQADQLSPYLAMVDLLLGQNKPAEAFDYAERANSLRLLNVVRGGNLKITKGMTPVEEEQERHLSGELVSLNAQLNRERQRPRPDEKLIAELGARQRRAQLEYTAYKTKLYAAHPALKVFRAEMKPLKLDQAKALIAATGSALVQFVVTEQRAYLFVLTREAGRQGGAGAGRRAAEEQGKNASSPPPQKTPAAQPTLKVYGLDIRRGDLAERVRSFRASLINRDEAFEKPARELYDLLLKPAQEQLAGQKALVIVPDAALWDLPFQALQPAENHYLIEDHVISYVPSLTGLREMMKPRSVSHSRRALAVPLLLAFANPALSSETMKRASANRSATMPASTPETEQEALALSQSFGVNRSKVYAGSEAREDRVKAEAGRSSVLHFAAPSELDDVSPMYSYIALAKGETSNREDGLLQAWELLKLELQAELAVVSTSSVITAEPSRPRSSDSNSSNSITAFSWSWFVAGCPTLVISRWETSAPARIELMKEFYRSLRAEDEPLHNRKARALQAAMLKLVRNESYRNPYYWTGFMAIGMPG